MASIYAMRDIQQETVGRGRPLLLATPCWGIATATARNIACGAWPATGVALASAAAGARAASFAAATLRSAATL